ncbi:MAG: winged helix-turn-helix domain-containing protein [Rhodocyclaceae bacterium]|jgi:predicted ArsR family transcriptional regulator|nr:winged helix-turn-helix domain-containing protein [Rhodocyclaceae bacterium]
MSTATILQHLKKHGQLRDAEIAQALGLGLGVVRTSLDALSASGEIACCNVTRYNDGKPVQEILCRMSGYVPPAAPGRKPKS